MPIKLGKKRSETQIFIVTRPLWFSLKQSYYLTENNCFTSGYLCDIFFFSVVVLDLFLLPWYIVDAFALRNDINIHFPWFRERTSRRPICTKCITNRTQNVKVSRFSKMKKEKNTRRIDGAQGVHRGKGAIYSIRLRPKTSLRRERRTFNRLISKIP